MQRVGIGMYIGIYLYLKKKHKYKPKLIKMIICKEKERTGRNGQKYKWDFVYASKVRYLSFTGNHRHALYT